MSSCKMKSCLAVHIDRYLNRSSSSAQSLCRVFAGSPWLSGNQDFAPCEYQAYFKHNDAYLNWGLLETAHSFLLQWKQQAVQKSVWWCGMASGSVWVGQSHMQLAKRLLTQDSWLSRWKCSERNLILQIFFEVVTGIKDIFYSSRILIILFKRINWRVS